MQIELTKEFIDQVKDAVDNQYSAFLKETFEDFYPTDAAEIMYELDTNECIYIINQIDEDFAAEVISYIDPVTRKGFLKNFDSEHIASYLKFIDSDDAVDIINELAVKQREEVIAHIERVNKEAAAYILELLRYEEDVAGGIMAKELIKAYIHWNVKQCIEEIRRQAENVERFYSVYVVDENEILLGIVSVKKLLLSQDYTTVKDIYDPDIICVESYRETEEVADMMEKYDLEAIPVVNVQGKLLGRITIDDVVDVIKERAERDRQAMTGISEDIEEDDNVWMLSRARLPWLVIGMLGGLLGARFIGLFEASLALVPAMAFFIPLITATGGNVGVQSSSIVVQSLASKSLMLDSLGQRLLRVLFVAVINGLVLAALVFGFNTVLGEKTNLAFVVSIALFCVVMLASLMGTITPIILDKLGINPALASGPFITTANDLLGLAVYFLVANMLLI